MGEIYRDHEERLLQLVNAKEFKVAHVSGGKAANACKKTSREWENDCADLVCCIPDRQPACSAAS